MQRDVAELFTATESEKLDEEAGSHDLGTERFNELDSRRGRAAGCQKIVENENARVLRDGVFRDFDRR